MWACPLHKTRHWDLTSECHRVSGITFDLCVLCRIDLFADWIMVGSESAGVFVAKWGQTEMNGVLFWNKSGNCLPDWAIVEALQLVSPHNSLMTSWRSKRCHNHHKSHPFFFLMLLFIPGVNDFSSFLSLSLSFPCYSFFCTSLSQSFSILSQV